MPCSAADRARPEEPDPARRRERCRCSARCSGRGRPRRLEVAGFAGAATELELVIEARRSLKKYEPSRLESPRSDGVLPPLPLLVLEAVSASVNSSHHPVREWLAGPGPEFHPTPISEKPPSMKEY